MSNERRLRRRERRRTKEREMCTPFDLLRPTQLLPLYGYLLKSNTNYILAIEYPVRADQPIRECFILSMGLFLSPTMPPSIPLSLSLFLALSLVPSLFLPLALSPSFPSLLFPLCSPHISPLIFIAYHALFFYLF